MEAKQKENIIKVLKPQTEKTILAEIFKQDGIITIEFPNESDILQFELYGFLDCYLDVLKEQLMNDIDNHNEE